jgi:CDP-diacylglycerol--glycerol-3-phosphate 3-phosphatidyltransferase
MPWYKKYLENIWNLPNVLTMLRLLSIPVYVFLFYKGFMLSAMCVFIAACLTDWFDGYLARKNNQITAFGKLMDPLADKLMVVTVMLTNVLAHRLPLLPLIILVCKELYMILGSWALIKYKDIVVYASPIGKVAQFAFCIGLSLTFLHKYFVDLKIKPDALVIWIAMVLALIACLHYTIAIVRQLKKKKAED